jgi:hypothetical protein
MGTIAENICQEIHKLLPKITTNGDLFAAVVDNEIAASNSKKSALWL